MSAKGIVYFVVGASGSGKDTLIGKGRAERPDLHFVQRAITRPVSEGDRTHTPLTATEFSDRKRANALVLTWDAHGHRYGVPDDVLDRVAAGESVVINGSRAAVHEARMAFDTLRIIHVTARLDVLSRRLRERGREDEAEIDRRMARANRNAPRGSDVVTVDNSGPLEEGFARFLAALA